MMGKALLFIISAVCAYLICGINPAIMLSKLVYHTDIRTVGSKNPGFTNFKRTFGWKLGWVVLLFDIAKSILPAAVFGILFGKLYGIYQLGTAFTVLFGMLGHAYPVWYGFRGGKAFLVWLSSTFLIDWRVGLIGAGVFLVLLFTVKIMSVASLSTAVIYPIVLAIFGASSIWVILLCAAESLLLIWRHRANLRRLIHGEEPKFALFGKKHNSVKVSSSK